MGDFFRFSGSARCSNYTPTLFIDVQPVFNEMVEDGYGWTNPTQTKSISHLFDAYYKRALYHLSYSPDHDLLTEHLSEAKKTA